MNRTSRPYCGEFREELGAEIRLLRHLWRSVTPWGVALTWWLSELQPQSTPVANPAEVESVHWFALHEMLQLPELLESNRDFLAAVARQEVDLAAELGSDRIVLLALPPSDGSAKDSF